MVEREVYGIAIARLQRAEDELKHLIADLGRAVGGSWRSEEKTATVAAWLVLAKFPRLDGNDHG